MPGGGPPDRGQLDGDGVLVRVPVAVEVGGPRAVGVETGVAAPRVRADLEGWQLADIPDADGDRCGLRDLVEQVVRQLPRLVDEQHVEHRAGFLVG